MDCDKNMTCEVVDLSHLAVGTSVPIIDVVGEIYYRFWTFGADEWKRVEIIINNKKEKLGRNLFWKAQITWASRRLRYLEPPTR